MVRNMTLNDKLQELQKNIKALISSREEKYQEHIRLLKEAAQAKSIYATAAGEAEKAKSIYVRVTQDFLERGPEAEARETEYYVDLD